VWHGMLSRDCPALIAYWALQNVILGALRFSSEYLIRVTTHNSFPPNYGSLFVKKSNKKIQHKKEII
jgi:hypothetical protein